MFHWQAILSTSAHLSGSEYNSISTCCYYYFSWGLGFLGMPQASKYDTLGRSDDRMALTEIYLSVHESVLWGQLLRSVLKQSQSQVHLT